MAKSNQDLAVAYSASRELYPNSHNKAMRFMVQRACWTEEAITSMWPIVEGLAHELFAVTTIDGWDVEAILENLATGIVTPFKADRRWRRRFAGLQKRD